MQRKRREQLKCHHILLLFFLVFIEDANLKLAFKKVLPKIVSSNAVVEPEPVSGDETKSSLAATELVQDVIQSALAVSCVVPAISNALATTKKIVNSTLEPVQTSQVSTPKSDDAIDDHTKESEVPSKVDPLKKEAQVNPEVQSIGSAEPVAVVEVQVKDFEVIPTTNLQAPVIGSAEPVAVVEDQVKDSEVIPTTVLQAPVIGSAEPVAVVEDHIIDSSELTSIIKDKIIVSQTSEVLATGSIEPDTAESDQLEEDEIVADRELAALLEENDNDDDGVSDDIIAISGKQLPNEDDTAQKVEVPEVGAKAVSPVQIGAEGGEDQPAAQSKNTLFKRIDERIASSNGKRRRIVPFVRPPPIARDQINVEYAIHDNKFYRADLAPRVEQRPITPRPTTPSLCRDPQQERELLSGEVISERLVRADELRNQAIAERLQRIADNRRKFERRRILLEENKQAKDRKNKEKDTKREEKKIKRDAERTQVNYWFCYLCVNKK